MSREPGGEVERLRAALEPFAKLARVRYPEEGGAPSWIDLMTNNGECDELELRSHVALDRDRAQLLDAADFRNAEAALSGEGASSAAMAVELAIALYLVSGWLPWGTDWRCEGEAPRIPLCSRSLTEPEEWILCCGHVVSATTMEDWLSRGYVAEGPPSKRFHRRTVVAGPKIDEWLGERWHALIPSDDTGPL